MKDTNRNILIAVSSISFLVGALAGKFLLIVATIVGALALGLYATLVLVKAARNK